MTMINNLRPYQWILLNSILNSFKENNTLVQLPTGGGKSVIFLMLRMILISLGYRVEIITESLQIQKQIPGSLMAQTVVRRNKMIHELQQESKLIVIVDEIHIGTPVKLLNQLPNARIIGFTATPSYDIAKHLPKMFTKILVGEQTKQLIELGFLSPYKHFARVTIDSSKLKKERGEYSLESQMQAFESTYILEGLQEDLKSITFKKCLIFCSSIQAADKLALSVPDSVVVHSNTPIENLLRFRNPNGSKICISVGMLTKGFDFPEIDLVVLHRATTSLALYLQMIGRGSRIFDGKDKFTVIDYGENYKRFGLWDQDRNWDQLWLEKPKKEGLALMRNCPKCGHIQYLAKSKCEECGFVFPVAIKEVSKNTKLIDVSSLLPPKKLTELGVKQLHNYANNTGDIANPMIILAKRNKEDFITFGNLRGKNYGWIFDKYRYRRHRDSITNLYG